MLAIRLRVRIGLTDAPSPFAHIARSKLVRLFRLRDVRGLRTALCSP